MTPAAYAWLAILGAALAYEIYAVLTKHATLSQYVWKQKSMAVAFGAGCLCGHLFLR